jgi:hypothetical protein
VIDSNTFVFIKGRFGVADINRRCGTCFTVVCGLRSTFLGGAGSRFADPLPVPVAATNQAAQTVTVSPVLTELSVTLFTWPAAVVHFGAAPLGSMA